MKKKNSNALLMVFMKNPIAGKVKTRLAVEIGKEEALNIYLRLIEHTQFVTSKILTKPRCQPQMKHEFLSSELNSSFSFLSAKFFRGRKNY